MNEITITFSDNSKKQFAYDTPIYEIASYYQTQSKTPIMGARINNEIISMNTKINKDCKIDFVDIFDPYGYRMYQGALKFIFEVAVKETIENTEVKFLHSVPKGIMTEIIGTNIVKEDLKKIKETMARIISNDEQIIKFNVSKKEAIKYFLKNNQLEKAKNIHNTNNEIVTIYRLEKYYNYYYTEMPYSTGKINKFDLVYLGKNKIVIVYPSSRTDGFVPEYVHYDNIINSFKNGEEWLNTMRINYLSDLNKCVSDGKIKKLIEANEFVFNDHISDVAKEINKNKDIKVVLLSGPSSSGKTTTTRRLSSYLESLGYNPIPISVDDYYKDEEDMKRDNVINYEVLESIDTKLFNQDINDLINGKIVHLPKYDFTKKRKTRDSKGVSFGENSILLIEGLHCLNDELTMDIESKYKYKIYLSPFIPLEIDRHNYISTVDLRLLRRIVRDNRTRATDVSETINMWQTVRSGEEKFIFPYIHQADIILNTAYVFEVGILKVFAEPLLYSVGLDSPFYEEARRLINSMQGFYPISSEYISKDSILREFIG